ncbi:hypothetical protein JCM10207_007041 [Rhodosporidiobolus poonsookiae]
MRSLTLSTALMATLASAHMQLMYPPPINSVYDPQTVEANKDYSMTSPLNADGSNYPCKGYNTAEAYSTLSAVATLKAGSNLEIAFAAGGATHMGGSCQFSISYDQGKTFAVIHSVLGGCPLQSNYSVPIPDDLPSATSATFAWTWQNEVGNREEYMNCAIVDIAGGSSKSFTGPGLFRANTFADGTCITVEGDDPVYPNPGKSVEYGGKITSSSPATVLSPCDYDQDTTVTVSPSGSSSSGGSGGSSTSKTTSKAASTTTSSSQIVIGSPTTTTRTRNSWRSTTTSTATATTTTRTRASWRTTTSAASPSQTMTSSAESYSAPSPTRNLHVTSATTSAAATAASSTGGSSSSRSGTWLECTSDSTWSLCSSDGCTAMGSVAAGTACKNDAIVALRKRAPMPQGRMERVPRRSAGANEVHRERQRLRRTQDGAHGHATRQQQRSKH